MATVYARLTAGSLTPTQKDAKCQKKVAVPLKTPQCGFTPQGPRVFWRNKQKTDSLTDDTFSSAFRQPDPSLRLLRLVAKPELQLEGQIAASVHTRTSQVLSIQIRHQEDGP